MQPRSKLSILDDISKKFAPKKKQFGSEKESLRRKKLQVGPIRLKDDEHPVTYRYITKSGIEKSDFNLTSHQVRVVDLKKHNSASKNRQNNKKAVISSLKLLSKQIVDFRTIENKRFSGKVKLSESDSESDSKLGASKNVIGSGNSGKKLRDLIIEEPKNNEPKVNSSKALNKSDPFYFHIKKLQTLTGKSKDNKFRYNRISPFPTVHRSVESDVEKSDRKLDEVDHIEKRQRRKSIELFVQMTETALEDISPQSPLGYLTSANVKESDVINQANFVKRSSQEELSPPVLPEGFILQEPPVSELVLPSSTDNIKTKEKLLISDPLIILSSNTQIQESNSPVQSNNKKPPEEVNFEVLKKSFLLAVELERSILVAMQVYNRFNSSK